MRLQSAEAVQDTRTVAFQTRGKEPVGHQPCLVCFGADRVCWRIRGATGDAQEFYFAWAATTNPNKL